MIRNVTFADIVEDYCDQVISGEVVACKSVIQAVERYRSDFARQNDGEFPFVFDAHTADKACQFFPLLLRHSIGEWVGQPFQLSPWQVFIVWNVFGWKRKDGTRRFRRAFISVARKNGKSTFCAGLEIYLAIADGEAGAQVFTGATKLDQARIIHHEAERMLRQSPHIAKHAAIFKDNITVPSSNSFLRPLGSDKPFDGLNPHAVFFDELHAWQEHHRKFYDTMTTGSGARTQPLQVTITTAGDDKSNIYNEEADYARHVVAGDFIDDTIFAMIFETDAEDDPMDSECWIKANPNLGVSVKADYLEQQATEARNKPQARSRFIRFHANRCVSSVENVVKPLSAPLSNWDEADSVQFGVDLGGRNDLAAYGKCARFLIGGDAEKPVWRYELTSRAFMASDTLRDLSQQPWAQWITDGYLTVGEYVVSALRDDLIEDCAVHNAQFIAFDPYNAQQIGEELEQAGFTPVKMPQTCGHFNETLDEYQSAIAEGRLIIDENDPVLAYACGNMAMKRNAAGLVMPDKKHSKDKIDPAVACLMAMRAVRAAPMRESGPLFIS